MMADISTTVRTEACVLLGKITSISEDDMLQALSKRMMRVELEQNQGKTTADPQDLQTGVRY